MHAYLGLLACFQELSEAQTDSANLEKLTCQLKEVTKKLEAAESKLANRDKSGQVKFTELKEANAKLQESSEKVYIHFHVCTHKVAWTMPRARAVEHALDHTATRPLTHVLTSYRQKL